MSHQVTLLVFGILLFLVGLVGKVKAKEIEVGTSSRMARIIMAIVGIVLVVLSFNPKMPKSFISKPPKQIMGGTQEGHEELKKESEQSRLTEEQRFKEAEQKRLAEKQHREKQLKGVYTIQQKSTMRYVDAFESSTIKHDYSLVTRNKQNNDTQRWILTPLGNNEYIIQQKSTMRYVDAFESSTIKHDYSLVTRDKQNNDTQRWILIPYKLSE